MQPQNPTTQEQLDPTVVNMARAIKSTETAGQANPYTARGKSGEFGAYQYTPDTWAADSQKYLGQAVPLEQSTVEQQNKVAYSKIKEFKDQGYNPAQVASIWNSGDPEAYKGTFSYATKTHQVGESSRGPSNVSGVAYDVPQYVNSVVSAYQQYKSGLTPKITPTPSTVGATETGQGAPSGISNAAAEPTLGQKLSARGKDIASNIADIVGQVSGQKGSQGWWSDLLQAGGSVAGGVGDMINSALELIPGVKGAENWIGGEVGKAADTKIGRAVVSSIQDFSKAHPELSKDIGAGFNILTAIPILKGLGVVKDVAASGLASALEGVATKGIANEITGTAARTVGGRAAVSELGDSLENVVKEGIVKPRALPEIVNGKYDVSEALAKTDDLRGQIAKKELQPVLDRLGDQPAGRLPVENLRQQAVAGAQRELQDTNAVNKMFDRIKTIYGDSPTLAEWNKAKQLVSKQVPQRAFDLEGYNANYNVRQTIQKGIESAGILQGLPDIGAINGKMRLLYQADDLLKSMDGKPVKVGLVSKLARKGVSVGAGMLANQMGGGVIGGLGAGYLTDIADKGIQGVGGSIRRGILNRTEPGALSELLKKGKQIAPKAVAGALAQKAAKQ